MKKILSLSLLLLASVIAFAQMDLQKPEGLQVGDKSPAIIGIDQNGKKVSLKEILKKGEAVLIFYRGQWCPYCNKQLSHLNDSLSYITSKGGTIITITPETADNIKKTISKTKASFSIVEDKGLAIMKAYKVSFAVDEKTIEKYKGYGIDFAKANGDNGANLPVPATYIVGKDGKIKYVFFNADYSKRASVKDIIDNL
jgi:peroxiredoxin